MEEVKFVLRLPPAVHKKVKRAAKANNTSMNKEITNLIVDQYSKTSIETRLDQIDETINKKLKAK